MISTHGTCIEGLETGLAEQDEQATLQGQAEEARRRSDDLEEWIASVAEDMLTQTRVP